MAEVAPNLNQPVPLREDEDDETLAAIDQGIRDADAGRVTPIEEVEKMLLQWISRPFWVD